MITRWLSLITAGAAVIASTSVADPAKVTTNRDAPQSSGKINAGRDASSVINGAGTAGATAGPAAAGGGTAGVHAPWAPAPAGYSGDGALAMVKTWAATVPGKKVVYIPPAAIGGRHDMTNQLRVAAAKAWNHLSWLPDLDIPQDISNGAGLAFALDPKKLWGADADTNWGYIANCTAKTGVSISPAPADNCTAFDANTPVEIPRFVFNAVNGGPYESVMQTPGFYSDFTNTYQLGPVEKVSTHHDAIVCGPRITAYRSVTTHNVKTYYAFTSDEFDGRADGNINYTTAPTDSDMRSTGAFNAGPNDASTAIASEWWIQLPNGFMYWGIQGEGGQERGKAEIPFAIDPAFWADNQASLATGRSCITCHAAGIQSARSDTAIQGQNGWTSQKDLDAFYVGIRGKFTGAMGTLAAGLSDNADTNSQMVNGTIEPIAQALSMIEGPYQPGSNQGSCTQFCNGKYGPPPGKNLCETLPVQ